MLISSTGGRARLGGGSPQQRPHSHQPLAASAARHLGRAPLGPRPRPPSAKGGAGAGEPAPIIDPQAAQRQRDLDTEDDLLQHPERCSWYEARFAGDGQPDWHPASVVANEPACPSVGVYGGGGGGGGGGNSPLTWRLVTLAYEASRERVPLRNAYTEPGQTARVRAGPAMTEEALLAVANPPPYEGEVMLPPVARRRPSVVAGGARRRIAARRAAQQARLADQTLVSSAAEGSLSADDDGEGAAGAPGSGTDTDSDGDGPSSSSSLEADAFDFDAPWRESPYYASGALPTPRETDKRLKEALFRVRGDIFANEVKTAREPVSAVAPLQLLVSPKQSPELCAAKPGDLVAVGPFEGTGLDVVRAGLLAVFRYRTLVLFVGGPDAGPGAVATARAMLLSGVGAHPTSLLPAMRQGGVVVYYWAPNGASVCFGQEDFDAWGSTTTMAYLEEEEGQAGGGTGGERLQRRITRLRANVRVVTTTRGFADAFDGDDDLTFDPDETAAVVLTGGDAAAEAAARQVCRDAEIGAVVTDGPEAPRNAAPEYLSSIPKAFSRWAEQSRDMRAAAEARDAAAAAAKKKNREEAAAADGEPAAAGGRSSAGASSR